MKLEIGYQHKFEVRTEYYKGTMPVPFSVLYISDLHLNSYSNNLINKLIENISQLNPSIILLGGDYVDTKNGLVYFSNLLKYLSKRKNVFAIAGNHDYFFNIQKIKKIILENRITWIEKRNTIIKLNNYTLEISGNQACRKKSNVDFRILCLHHPIDVRPFKDIYNLIFAGHLHGCQFVWRQTTKGLYPGKWFYKWNILKLKLDNCLFLISKGLGDTLPIRYNCMKDIIFINVLKKTEYQNP